MKIGLMILYDNNPIITDIFLRGQDRKILLESEDEQKEALKKIESSNKQFKILVKYEE